MPMIRRSPLFRAQSEMGAEFSPHDSWELAAHFGNPRDEYEAVCRGAGLLDACPDGRIKVTGKDRIRYLNNMLSNDIQGLEDGVGCYATLLTHQGHIESDLHCFSREDEVWVTCPAAGHGRVLETLHKFIVADAVSIQDCSTEWGMLSVQGPGAGVVLEEIWGESLEDLPTLGHRSKSTDGWMVVRRDRTGYGGFDLLLPASQLEEMWKRIATQEGVRAIGSTASNWLRTEAGVPWFGVDMNESNLPLEVGLNHAISTTKGCYRGQEIIARIVHRGHLDRRLGGVVIEFETPPERGAEIQHGDQKVGSVTSAILSPRLGKPLCLAILKNDFSSPGTDVTVRYGSASHPGSVIGLPLPH